jgi:multidrug efflux pump subunit AcrB
MVPALAVFSFFPTSHRQNDTELCLAPNLQVDILRDQAKLYGVSETRILTLLHDAYSQNYSYLIKKPTDQYQVILEVADDKRSAPEDLGKLYIKSDDGRRMVPLNAVTCLSLLSLWRTRIREVKHNLYVWIGVGSIIRKFDAELRLGF